MDTRNITNRSDCMAANYRWVHHKYNFDNLGQVSTTVLALIRPSPLLDASGSGNHRPGLSCTARTDTDFSSPSLSFLFCKMGKGSTHLSGGMRLTESVGRVPSKCLHLVGAL